MNAEDYFIMFECENGDDNSHYVDLWIFIREYNLSSNAKIGKEEEWAIKMKIYRMIEKNYTDTQNWSDETNCSYFHERIYGNIFGLSRCWMDRLETCVPKKKDIAPIVIIIYLMKKYGIVNLFILLIVMMWYLVGKKKWIYK